MFAVAPAVAQLARGRGQRHRRRRGVRRLAGLARHGPGVGIGVVHQQARRVQLGGVQLHPARGHGLAHEGGAADVGQGGDLLALAQPVGDLQDLPLAVAVDQQVGLAVDQGRAPHLVRPVVVVGDAPQAGLDAADDDGHVLEGLAAALGVDQHRPVGAAIALGIGGVGVVVAQPPLGRVAVDHGIEVARGDPEEEIGTAQGPERIGALPVGLADDAHPVALVLEHPAHHRHAEAGVVDVGVAGDHDHVAGFPAQGVHLGPCRRQLGGDAEAGGPVAGSREQGHGLGHGRRGHGGMACRKRVLAKPERRAH